jgi:hypothetical protein
MLGVFALASLFASCGGSSSSNGGPPPSPDFSITVSPNSATVPPGGQTQVQIIVAAQNGFTGSVSINITGLPSGATSVPSSPFVMSAGSQNVTINIPTSSAQGSFTTGVAGSSGKLEHSANLALQVQSLTLANFSITLNNTELSFTQGSSAYTTAGISLMSAGNSNFEVQFSVTGLPAGVQATFVQNPLAPSQPATLLTFTASPTSSVANYAPITITGTRTADGVQESAQLQINVTPPVGTLPAIKTDFIREDGTPAAAIYDSAHNVIYASNTQWNRVDVISPTMHQILHTIPAPSPTGMDMSLDGKHLVVTSNLQQIVSIDTTSLQVVQRNAVTPVVQGGASYTIPGLIANTSNGTALVGMTNFSSPPSYYLEQWNPASGSFTALSAPGVTAWINQLVRTGDGSKVLVVDYGTDVNLAVYDAASNTFTASGQSPVGQVLGVAASPTAEQFAIVGTTGFAILDTNLQLVAVPPLGGAFWGMTYSPDGTKLYANMTLQLTLTGPTYPVILTYGTNPYALIGVAPAFAGGNYSPIAGFQATPYTADNSGLIYGGLSHGLVVDDSTNYQNVLSLPVGPPYGEINADEAPLSAPYATGLGQAGFDVLPDIWFGNARGTNTQFSNGPLVSVTAPASPNAGLVNVKGVMPDGWFFFMPQVFSYGSKILFAGGNSGSTEGGASLALIGYGLLGDNGSPAVTIGGKAATVTGAGKYQYFNDSGFNISYPFFGMDEVMVTIPPGPPGPADITLTSSAGASTLKNGFTYLSVFDYSSADTFTFLLYDAQRHWVYLSAGDHIDVFSADTNQFLTPIVPPSVSGARQIKGLALTPDNSKLLVANFADVSIAIINPDNPTSSSVVKIPVSIVNAPGVADIAATSTGKAFVDGVSGTFSGCANGQLFEVDLATLSVTLRTDIPTMQVAANALSRTTTGDHVLVAGVGGCGTYLWSSATDQFGTGIGLYSGSSTTSGDGYWFASDYIRLDSNMVQRMQTQFPEFYTALLYSLDYAGEKFNASGSLLYSPVLQGFGNVESNGIQITDTNLGSSLGQILLTEQISNAQIPMDFDEGNNRLFLITNKGLTLINLATPPLSIGYLSPATGPTSGSTVVKIRGSGFQSGATVTFGGATVQGTFVDSSTLQVSTPSGSAGGVRVSIKNPDGTSYSLDAAFTYQ